MRTRSRRHAHRILASVESLEHRQLLSTVDIGGYGAVANDGADDAAAIQAAINASQTGDTVHFGAGTFDLLSTLTLLPGRTYSGDAGAILRMSNSAGGNPSIARTIYAQDSNITIQGLSFDANGVGGGIRMSINGGTDVPATGITITNCTFRNTRSAPSGGWDWAIYSNTGIQTATIRNNAYSNDGGGIYLANPNNLQVTDNTFTNILSQDAIFVPINVRPFTYGNGIVLSRNSGSGLHRMAIELWGGGGNAPQSPLIENNAFSNWVAGSGECYGISAVTGVNIGVHGNVFTGGTDSYGIEIAGQNSDVSGNVIDGFQNSIGIGGAPGVHIHGNMLRNASDTGIQLYGAGHADGLLIEKNVIVNAKNTGISMLPAGAWYGTIQNNAILRSAIGGDFTGINFNTPSTAGATSVSSNLVDQQTSDHSFWLIGIYAAGVSGMHIDNNVILSEATSPWSHGIVAPSGGALQGVYITGNTFQNLYWVVGNNQGTPVASGNVAVNCLYASQGGWTLPLSMITHAVPAAVISATPAAGTSPLLVSFSSSGSSESGGSIAASQWYFAGGGAGAIPTGTSTSDTFTATAPTNVTSVLAVKDTAGAYAVATQVISIQSAAVVNPVGQWKLDETTGTVANDSSSNHDNGTLLNSPIWTAGKVNNSLSFNGSNQSVSIPDSSTLQFSGDMSMAFWIKLTGNPTDYTRIIGKGGNSGAGARNYGLWLEPGASPRLLFQQYNSNGNAVINLYSNTRISLSQWYHIAVTISGNNVAIYVNGVSDATGTRSGAPATSADPLTFGYAGYYGYYNGLLDEVNLYNQAISTTLVQQLASAGTYVAPSPTGYWKLDDSGTTAADSSGNGYSGTTINGPSHVAGHSGNALSLNGTSQYVDLGNPAGLNITGQITLSAWIKPTATDGFCDILAHGYTLNPSAETFLRINNGYYEVGSWDNNGNAHVARYAIPSGDLNTWVMVTGTYDGANWNLYRNGVLVASTADTVGAVAVSANWSIGAQGGGGGRFFAGAIDEVRIYNMAMSATDILNLYNS